MTWIPASPTRLALLAAFLLAAPAGGVSAQEVKWRTDYNSVRREANQKGKPILIDFGTENCFWCKKLDAGPFRDPAIVATLNEQFVPLKIDADRETTLTQTLRIQSYPTLVLAAPDGKILGLIEGYLEAPRLNEHLQRAVSAVVSPDWMVRDLKEASKAVGTSEYGRAIALLKSIGEDGKQRPVQVKAKQMLADIEQQAADQLARARALTDKGQSEEAIETLTKMLRQYSGSQAAADASSLLSTLAAKPENRNRQRSKLARDLLAQAREEYRTQHYFSCLDKCEVLASTYADLAEGAEAIQLAAEIKGNPEWMARACEDLGDRLAVMYMALAETHLKRGQPKLAEECLQKVIRTCPDTARAEKARARMVAIQGTFTQQAEFNKKHAVP